MGGSRSRIVITKRSGGEGVKKMDTIDNPLKVAEKRSLLPFLPMIYIAWAGGELSSAELQGLRERLEQLGDLDADAQILLNLWLDPAAPPSAAQLQILLGSIQDRVPKSPEVADMSLAQLGMSLANGSAFPGLEEALDEIQTTLGAYGCEATRELLAEVLPKPTPDRESAGPSQPEFPLEALIEMLEAPYEKRRAWMRRVLAHPRYFHRYGESKEIFRERIVTWCRELAREGLSGIPWPEEYGGENDLGGFIAAAEVMASFDVSLLIKFGVHIGLFAGSIYNLGSKRHHDAYLRRAIKFELPGCFAMTETGHGSNVRDIETTAHYDPVTEEFLINTPHPGARKDYIGNAALHAQLATVFCQLHLNGTDYGVHAFLVPIRNKDGSILPGITIEDNGEKIGLQGVDNGRITFNNVRVPRENLLDRFAQVSPEGAYSSPINNSGKRFFMMLSTLVMGRISIAAAANSISKVGLAITVRYAEQRKQFGPPGAGEVPILDYQTFQRRLFPHLATAYALTFACQDMVKLLVDGSHEVQRELESLAAGLKAYTSWHTIEALQVCRESCGGQGYLSVNRLGTLKADTDVFATFEGANPVLLQLVAKGLLTEYRQQFSGNKFFGIVKFLTNKAATVVTEQNPMTIRNTDPAHLRDPEFHLSALRFREESLLASAARRLKSRLDKKMDSFVAFNECQDHLVALANAHIERVILESFQKGVAACSEPQVREVLGKVCCLFALTRIQQDAGWFLEAGLLEPSKSRAIRSQVYDLCAELRPFARILVDGFNLPDKFLSAPIALGDVPA